MASVEMDASLIVTDSGGVQKEAFFYGVPCVVAFPVASWPEIVDLGHNVVGGISTASIVSASWAALTRGRYQPSLSVFGDGHAANRIAEILTTKDLKDA
jgi:UDP-GlcNAc3NAcA epimerase